MGNGKDIYSGIVRTNSDRDIPIKMKSFGDQFGAWPVKSTFPFPGTGFSFPELASTDLHLVADDLTPTSNWSSRIGGWTATRTGSPSIGMETPLYPAGGFAGSGYRQGVGVFGAAIYYALPYNAAHAITSSSTVSYRLLLKTGNIAQEETYIARYITASSKPNFRVYTKADPVGGAYKLFVEIGHSTTNALTKALVPQAGFIDLVFTYDGTSKVLNMYINGMAPSETGDVATSTGVGTIITDTSTGIFLGITDATFGLPSIQGQLIEIERHQEVLNLTTVAQQFQKMTGVVLPGDIYPAISPVRNTFGVGRINKKLWVFGKNWPIINEKGLYCNQPTGCTMYETAITDNGTSITRTAGVTLISEAGSFNSQVIGKTASIVFDGTLQTAAWRHFGLASLVKSAMTVVWRGINSAIAYGYIKDVTSASYYDPGTSTWGASAVAIDLSAFVVSGSGTLTDPYVSNVPFTTSVYAGNHPFDAVVHNNSQMNATQSVRVYHCQACDSGQFFAAPFTVTHPTGSSGTVFLGFGVEYPPSVINWIAGRMNFTIYPGYSSSQPVVSPANGITIFSGSTSTQAVFLSIGSAALRLRDVSGHNASASTTFSQEERLDLQADWSNSNLKIAITNKGVSGSAIYTSPLSAGNFKIGTSSQTPCCYISNLVIR